MMGRAPERWRLDAMGIPVCKALRGCHGPLCHEYDHIIPFSKGGQTTIDNCQILQTTLNKVKSNKVGITYHELLQHAPKITFTDDQLDAVELAVFGNVSRAKLDVMKRPAQKIEVVNYPLLSAISPATPSPFTTLNPEPKESSTSHSRKPRGKKEGVPSQSTANPD
jgi:hypothetical protein